MLWLWVQDWILWIANLWFPFYEICTQNQRGIKFWDTVENSDTGGPSSITVNMEYLLAFQYWYCELCVQNRWEWGRKHCFVFCVFFGGAWIVDGWEVVRWGRKSYLGAAEIASFFSRDFSRSMTHSDMMQRLDISTFYFYEPLLFLSLGNL